MRVFVFTIILLFANVLHAKTVLVLGDSLTEGYRLAKEEAFPHLIEEELKKEHPSIKVINGGVSGATTASAMKRLDWYLKAGPEIMVLALGANDGLRGLKVSEAEKNLSGVIEKAKSKNIEVIIAGMEIPSNYGEKYRQDFRAIYPRLAKKYDITLIPFLLQDVATIKELNLTDGIHPNPEGHKIMAKTVIKYLGPKL